MKEFTDGAFEALRVEAELNRSIARGVGRGLTNFGHFVYDAITDPENTLVRPIATLYRDARIVYLSQHPTSVFPDLEPSGFCDTYTRPHLIKQIADNPQIVVEAKDRMYTAFVDTPKQIWNAYKTSNPFQRVEMATTQLTELFTPYGLTKAVGVTANLYRFGAAKPPLHAPYVRAGFTSLAEEAVSTPHFKPMSVADIRKIKGEKQLMYALTDENKLTIHEVWFSEPRPRPKPLTYYSWVEEGWITEYFSDGLSHHELAGFRPVYSAGEIHVANGKIIGVNNGSGCYAPQGTHLKDIIKTSFKRHGFKENFPIEILFEEEMHRATFFPSSPVLDTSSLAIGAGLGLSVTNLDYTRSIDWDFSLSKFFFPSAYAAQDYGVQTVPSLQSSDGAVFDLMQFAGSSGGNALDVTHQFLKNSAVAHMSTMTTNKKTAQPIFTHDAIVSLKNSLANEVGNAFKDISPKKDNPGENSIKLTKIANKMQQFGRAAWGLSTIIGEPEFGAKFATITNGVFEIIMGVASDNLMGMVAGFLGGIGTIFNVFSNDNVFEELHRSLSEQIKQLSELLLDVFNDLKHDNVIFFNSLKRIEENIYVLQRGQEKILADTWRILHNEKLHFRTQYIDDTLESAEDFLGNFELRSSYSRKELQLHYKNLIDLAQRKSFHQTLIGSESGCRPIDTANLALNPADNIGLIHCLTMQETLSDFYLSNLSVFGRSIATLTGLMRKTRILPEEWGHKAAMLNLFEKINSKLDYTRSFILQQRANVELYESMRAKTLTAIEQARDAFFEADRRYVMERIVDLLPNSVMEKIKNKRTVTMFDFRVSSIDYYETSDGWWVDPRLSFEVNVEYHTSLSLNNRDTMLTLSVLDNTFLNKTLIDYAKIEKYHNHHFKIPRVVTNKIAKKTFEDLLLNIDDVFLGEIWHSGIDGHTVVSRLASWPKYSKSFHMDEDLKLTDGFLVLQKLEESVRDARSKHRIKLANDIVEQLRAYGSPLFMAIDKLTQESGLIYHASCLFFPEICTTDPTFSIFREKMLGFWSRDALMVKLLHYQGEYDFILEWLHDYKELLNYVSDVMIGAAKAEKSLSDLLGQQVFALDPLVKELKQAIEGASQNWFIRNLNKIGSFFLKQKDETSNLRKQLDIEKLNAFCSEVRSNPTLLEYFDFCQYDKLPEVHFMFSEEWQTQPEHWPEWSEEAARARGEFDIQINAHDLIRSTVDNFSSTVMLGMALYELGKNWWQNRNVKDFEEIEDDYLGKSEYDQATVWCWAQIEEIFDLKNSILVVDLSSNFDFPDPGKFTTQIGLPVVMHNTLRKEVEGFSGALDFCIVQITAIENSEYYPTRVEVEELIEDIRYLKQSLQNQIERTRSLISNPSVIFSNPTFFKYHERIFKSTDQVEYESTNRNKCREEVKNAAWDIAQRVVLGIGKETDIPAVVEDGVPIEPVDTDRILTGNPMAMFSRTGLPDSHMIEESHAVEMP